jgi:hypothetical protein
MGHVSADQFPTRRFVSRQARMIAVVLWVLVGFAWWGVGTDSASQLTGQVAITIALVLASWLVLWRPHLTVTAHQIDVRNPFRRHVIPWGAINVIDTSWQVVLTTDTTRIGVWSAVAGGRHTSFWASRDQGQHLPPSTYRGGVVKPGDLLGSESGEIGAVIRYYWENRRGSASSTPSPPQTAAQAPAQATTQASSHTVDWVGVVGGVAAVAAGTLALAVFSV